MITKEDFSVVLQNRPLIEDPELFSIDLSKILKGFDFSSIPIDFSATF